MSSIITFPIEHWALILFTAGPCVLLVALAMKLRQTRDAILRRESEYEIHQAMAMHIERQRADQIDMEMRELAKLGYDPSQLRMLEPGIYVEDEEDDDDYYD